MATENGQSPKELYVEFLRAEIARLYALLDAVESEGENLAPATVGATPAARSVAGSPVRPDSFHAMSTPQAVREFLEMMGKGNPQTPAAIADALVHGGHAKLDERASVLNNVYTALRRGRGAGGFEKVGKLFGLAEWYPQKPKPEPTPTKKKSRKGSKKKARAKAAPERAAEPSPAPVGGWRVFLTKKLADGKTMKEAAAEWKSHSARAD
jgi:hypothetical protein